MPNLEQEIYDYVESMGFATTQELAGVFNHSTDFFDAFMQLTKEYKLVVVPANHGVSAGWKVGNNA